MHFAAKPGRAAAVVTRSRRQPPTSWWATTATDCTPVPIPLRPERSDTGSVRTYLLPPLAPPIPAPVAVGPAGNDGRPTADRDVDATRSRAGTPASRAGGMPTALEPRNRPLPMPGDELARRHRSLAFDRLLNAVHREHLSPFDLRVLLRVTDREATVVDLAESLGQPPRVLGRASARLVARGLLRRRRRRDRHDHMEVTLATTASGMSALSRVTQALELAPRRSERPRNQFGMTRRSTSEYVGTPARSDTSMTGQPGHADEASRHRAEELAAQRPATPRRSGQRQPGALRQSASAQTDGHRAL
jgi:DNA-binding MarR family transcriptional regulator